MRCTPTGPSNGNQNTGAHIRYSALAQGDAKGQSIQGVVVQDQSQPRRENGYVRSDQEGSNVMQFNADQDHQPRRGNVNIQEAAEKYSDQEQPRQNAYASDGQQKANVQYQEQSGQNELLRDANGRYIVPNNQNRNQQWKQDDHGLNVPQKVEDATKKSQIGVNSNIAEERAFDIIGERQLNERSYRAFLLGDRKDDEKDQNGDMGISSNKKGMLQNVQDNNALRDNQIDHRAEEHAQNIKISGHLGDQEELDITRQQNMKGFDSDTNDNDLHRANEYSNMHQLAVPTEVQNVNEHQNVVDDNENQSSDPDDSRVKYQEPNNQNIDDKNNGISYQKQNGQNIADENQNGDSDDNRVRYQEPDTDRAHYQEQNVANDDDSDVHYQNQNDDGNVNKIPYQEHNGIRYQELNNPYIRNDSEGDGRYQDQNGDQNIQDDDDDEIRVQEINDFRPADTPERSWAMNHDRQPLDKEISLDVRGQDDGPGEEVVLVPVEEKDRLHQPNAMARIRDEAQRFSNLGGRSILSSRCHIFSWLLL